MPPIVWEPEKVLAEGEPGSEHEVSVHFTASKSLSNLVVDVVPELEDFVTAVPGEFDEVEADTTTAVDLTISIPIGVEPGTYDGTLRLRQGRRTIARPLPIEVTVTAQERVTLTMVEPEGGGTVKPTVGTHTYTPGHEVELRAAPEEGWQFDQWFVDGADGPETAETTVTMDTDRSVQAVFDETDEIPEVEVPPVDTSVPTTIDQSTQFLYTGQDPIQVRVDPDDIVSRRAAVIRGQVVDHDGAPIAGVTVSVLDHPEYGHTLTRTEGWFDMAVNGGGELTIDFQHDDYLSAQRHVEVPWQDFEVLPGVTLIQLDEAATIMDLSGNETQVHQAATVVDDDGERTATVLVPEEVSTATMTLPDGTAQTLEEVTVRATEYTESDAGLEAMPAELPPQVAYTYAVELSIDEAHDADATHVEFDAPVVSYIDDFIGFGAGENVPTAYYDRERGEWIPVEDGVIIEVVGITDSRADLDVTGDGAADDPATLNEYGITDAEQTVLTDLYDVGDVFWRVTVEHFSAWDCNWPFMPPDGAEFPGLFEWLFGGLSGPDVDCQQAGSKIDCLGQTLRTDIDVTGTDQALHYSSRRAPARQGTIEFPVTGDSLPGPLKRVEVEIHVAGQRHTRTYDDPLPEMFDEFEWDGLDAYGRPVQGEQLVTVRIGYVYQGVYATSRREEVEANFGWFPTDVTGDRTREEVILQQNWTGTIGAPTPDAVGIGGWSVTDHHRYDPHGRILYRGDGTQRSADTLPPIIMTVAGTGDRGSSGDGGLATDARLNFPWGIAADPDGSVYVAEWLGDRVRRIDPDGVVVTVAGTGGRGSSGDGGPAIEAQIDHPQGLAVGPDGSVYIAESFRVRRVDPDGIITTVAGTGEQLSEFDGSSGGDGGPATEAQIDIAQGVAVAPDGSLYIAEWHDGFGRRKNRIRRVGPDGIITTIAGRIGPGGFSGDDSSATEAQLNHPSDVTVGPDGSVYIADFSNNRVRRIAPDGIITTIAGSGDLGVGRGGFGGDGGLATDANLNGPRGVAATSDGSLYIADNFNSRVRRVGPDGIITTAAGTGDGSFGGDGGPATEGSTSAYTVAEGPNGNLYIADGSNHRVRSVQQSVGGYDGQEQLVASSDGEELYVFNPSGRHLETVHALTGEVLLTFDYDVEGRLVGLTDADGTSIEIARDTGGASTALSAPFGQKTELAVDDKGYLSGVVDPAGQQWQLTHTADGLLSSRTDPRGHTSEYNYDDAGLLVAIHGPDGAIGTLARTDTGASIEVVYTSGEGRQTHYTSERTDEGGRRVVTVMPSGARKELLTRSGIQKATYADGTAVTLRQTGDPRFGMQTPVITELTITTPGGRTTTTEVEREVTLTDPDDPLSVDRVQDTVVINDQLSERVYDADTRTVTVTSAAGREWTAALDGLGRPVRIDGHTAFDPERFNYDERGLLTELSHGSRSWTYTHDTSGHVETVETAASQTFAYSYDDADRLISTTLPSGAIYGFGYDATDTPTQIAMPNGAIHELDYTHRGQLTSYTPPESTASLKRSFDADQWLQRRTLPSGRIIDLGYDGGRLTGQEYEEATVEFGYVDGDTTDRQQQATWSPTDGGTGQEITFDHDSTLVTEMDWTGAADGAFSYVYDDNFFLTGMTLTSGDDTVEAELLRDGDGAITGFGPFTLARDGPNREISAISDGTLTVDLDYNSHAEVSGRSQMVDSAQVYALELGYDDAGRIVQRGETVTGDATVYDYAYDPDSRLVEVQRDGTVVEAYDYDDNGNRISRQFDGGSVETATYDSQDRLIEFGDIAYEFDEDGFLAGRADDTFSYSARGELLEATVDGQTVTYTYDAVGRRVARTDSTGTTEYLYGNPGDPFQVTAMRDPNGVLSFFYYDPQGLLYALEREGDRYYIATDQVGTPRVIADASGETVRVVDYDSFGNRTTDTNPDFEIGIGFAGGLSDSVTGLVRFGMRDYDPNIGRWTARDPSLFAGEQANLYVYVNNSPITLRDPSGLQGVKVGGSGFAGFGAGGELTIGPEGTSLCVEVGIGMGMAADVDPYAGPVKAGTRTQVSAAAGYGPASAGVGITLHPCSSSPDFKATAGFGPGTVGLGTDGDGIGVDFSVGGDFSDLPKTVRETVSTSNMRFGVQAKATLQHCFVW